MRLFIAERITTLLACLAFAFIMGTIAQITHHSFWQTFILIAILGILTFCGGREDPKTLAAMSASSRHDRKIR